ncbi:sce7726 family protein [Wenzhouxiangella limi]|uniref:Sce7726 family protein n=1 Tax=Wenzhouxiangella limi TaxID=2707351 RepID=A0A845UXV2_9GAMM|nr:sce7726 family protein [Wenzhouxiangella limi]NDY95052.1 sce7726 family protein [Wenzhouxiangella limi]
MKADRRGEIARATLLPVFSPKVLLEQAAEGNAGKLMAGRRALEQYGLICEKASMHDVFERAYSVLLESYPAEYLLLNESLGQWLREAGSGQKVAVYREFPVGNCKADMAIFLADQSVGFEAKSRYDRLDRLKDQLRAYQKVFTRSYVVTDDTLVSSVLNESPREVGVWSVSSVGIREIRPAKEAADLICQIQLFRLLRKPEYLDLIRTEFGASPTLPNTQIYRACLKLFQKIEPARAQSLVSDLLVRRQCRPLPANDLAWQIPRSLRLLAFAGNFTQSELEVVCRVLNG